MEDFGGFDDFLIEMDKISVTKVKKFDRMWRAEEGGSVSSGIVLHNGKAYFCAMNKNIYCINPNNGELIWKYKTEGPLVECTPVITDGLLYATSFDRNVYALDSETGNLVWKYETQDKIASSVAVSDGMVFFGGKDENVYALDSKTGNLIWKFKTQGAISSQPAVGNGNVYIGSYDQNAYCLEANTGKLVWKLHTQGEIHNTNPFAIRDGVVYFGSFDNNTRAVDAQTGALLWKTRLGNYGMTASPVIVGKKIFQPTRDGILFALDFEGKILWKRSIDEKDVIGAPDFHDGKLFVSSCGDYHVHCITTEGEELWKFRTKLWVYERTALIGRTLIIPSWDCNVYAIDVDTQRVLWKFSVGGSPSYVPPPHEAFELEISVPQEEIEEKKKTYDLDLSEEGEERTDFYKTRMTYQVSNQYVAKGKYQINSDEEEF